MKDNCKPNQVVILECFFLLSIIIVFNCVKLNRFTAEDVSSQNQVKASVQRKIRQSIADEYPGLEPVLDDLLPKKSPLIVVKCQNHLNLVLVNNVPLFFNIRDGPYMPTLRLLHQYPDVMKKFQVDRGAIKFVLAGANIMCPGLTSPGGILDDEVLEETPVAIMAEGKQHALAIGFTKMAAKDIRAVNKGIGVDNMHYLNDGLWKVINRIHVSLTVVGLCTLSKVIVVLATTTCMMELIFAE
ncbi:Malignant T-cell-amplified sequence 1 [Nymphaea thermarum]|nr:Malignant T-cell-amplified sequence 1 [Nymphaea thermarum]